MLVVPYNYKKTEEVMKEDKIITINPSRDLIRLDSVNIKYEGKTKYLNRSTHLGRFYRGTIFEIYDFICSRTNLLNGDVESMQASTTNALDGNYSNIPIPCNYIEPELSSDIAKYFDRPIYDLSKLRSDHRYEVRNAELCDNCNMVVAADCYEDNFNIGFSETIGTLAALITSTALSVPFRANIVLDTDFGIMVNKMYPLIKDSDVQTVFEQEKKYFLKALNVVNHRIMDECKKYGNRMRIYASIREFDSYIVVVNTDNNQKFNLHLNNSDHTRTMMTTMAHDGSHYYNSNAFGDLIEMKIKTVMACMFDTEEQRYAYQVETETNNYEVTYE